MQKSIRMSTFDQGILQAIADLDYRIEPGHEVEAINLAVVDLDAYLKEAGSNYLVTLNTTKVDIPKGINVPEGIRTTTFNVDDGAYERVFEAVKKQMGLVKPRASFVIRLALRGHLQRLLGNAKESEPEIKVTSVDGVKLISRLAEVIQKNDIDKIRRIKDILEMEEDK